MFRCCRLLICLICVLYEVGTHTAFAQDTNTATSSTLILGGVTVRGNKKTLEKVIIREMDVIQGDTLAAGKLEETLKRNTERVRSTGLFVEVHLTETMRRADTTFWMLELREAQYNYIYPYLDFGDRDVNLWWHYGHSLARLNYQLKFTNLNLSGNYDRLSIQTQYGYAPLVAAAYQTPYLDAHQKWRASLNASYQQRHEIQYSTLGNKQIFTADPDRFLFRKFIASANITYRPKAYFSQGGGITYTRAEIADTVSKLNPDFFLGQTLQSSIDVGYWATYDFRDFRPYPMHGWRASGSIDYEGFGNAGAPERISIELYYSKYFSFTDHLSLEAIAKLHYVPYSVRQPYFNLHNLGYTDDVLRGYEYYAMDGQDFAYIKTSLRYRIARSNVYLGKWMPIVKFRYIPFKVYLTINNDIGYSRNYNSTENLRNPFTNTLLWGGGGGLDLNFFADFVLHYEYSFNQRGEHGLFIRWSIPF